MKRLYSCIFFLTLLLFFFQAKASKSKNPKSKRFFQQPLVEASFDQCSRKISFKIEYHEDFTSDDDQMRDFHVKASAPGVSEYTIAELYWEDNGPPGGANASVNDEGNDTYYCYTRGGSSISWNGQSHSGDDYYVHFDWNSIPSSFFGKTITLSVSGMYEYESFNIIKTFNFQGPSTPVGLQASSDTDCDKINLTWNATDLSLCTSLTRGYRIFRNDVFLASVDQNTTSYSDNTAVKGTNYAYKISSYYDYGGVYNESALSSPVTGRRTGPLAAPSGVTASNDDCSGKVKLTWTWTTGTNPVSYTVQRATNSAFTTGVTNIANISGDKREYQDTPPAKNTIYYYRMYSVNVCSDASAPSSSVTGMAPSEPASPTNVVAVADPTTNKITVTWTDNSSNETGFIIKRSLLGGGGTSSFPIGPNLTSYVDNSITNCVTYVYEVVAKNNCAPNGSESISNSTAKLVPIITNTFTGKTFTVSKGYYPNTVQLEWTNNNDQQINAFKIRRRILGSTSSPSQIASLNKGTSIYLDNTAEAGIMYEYFIQAEGQCENGMIYSETVSDVGFRSPAGTVNGHIEYTGGIAVEGARVLVSTAAGAKGSSLKFNGTTNKITVPHSVGLMPSAALTLEAYVRPITLTANATFISKTTGGNDGYGLEYVLSGNKTRFWVSVGGTIQAAEFAGALVEGNYYQLTGTFDGAEVKLYVDGVLKATSAASGSIDSNISSLYLGAKNTSNFFNGYLDEVRIWNIARSATEIARDYNRILTPSETGLVAYWWLDENVGDYIYDASKTGNIYNQNDGAITGASWSTVIPPTSQLGLFGVTNASGDYTISNIRYTGTGENFTLTPFFNIHAFTPSSKVLFIGEGQAIQNNQNFEDISSFEVTGTVKFENTSCYAKDVLVLIDGKPVVKAGSAVMTDASGYFDIRVPIGDHTISVEKSGHTFSVGKWPTNADTYNFQAPVSGIEFIDATLVKVVGRVVGGLREANKNPGMGRSINNIGTATMTFKSQQGNGCLTKTILTDDTTGEYSVELPPLKYEISELKIPSNLSVDFGTLSLIDLTLNYPLQKVIDTLFIEGTKNIKQIDSTSFHLRKDYVYRVAPEIDVRDKEDKNPFIGDTLVTYTDPVTNTKTSINLKQNPFPYAVVSQNQTYDALIKVFEKYTNYDNTTPIEDKVPVTDGKITINNFLAQETNQEIDLEGGDTLYSFIGGYPNTLINATIPEYSYTSTFEIDVEVGPYAVKWLPLPTQPGGDKFFRGYVFGGRSLGNSFATEGPQVVDHILRDPPGSQSYAFLEKGTSTKSFSSWEVNTGTSLNFNKRIALGTKFTIGLGLQTPTEIKNDLTLGTTVEASVTPGGEYEEVTTINERWETSGNPENVGAGSDLFIGSSKNFNYGVVENIGLVANTTCSMGGVECSSASNSGFTIGKTKGLFVVPGGYGTGFIYAQEHIESKLIPGLEALRNSLFVQQPARYQSKLTSSNANYGKNNDDPVWGTSVSSSTPTITEVADYDGQSYKFNQTTSASVDSIRYYNQQIRLWKEALARNEKEKIEGKLKTNHSFNAGPTYEYSNTSESTDATTFSWEVAVTEEAKLGISAEVGGTGFEIDQSLAVNVTSGGSSVESTTLTTTIGYVLHDDETGDFISVDVKEGGPNNGFVFATKAGETSCPYEGAVVTKYYNPGTVISEATLQREVPVISVSPSILINVPSDQPAVFNLSLGNNSASNDEMTYALKVLESSNPNGAVLLLDGLTPNRTFTVPAGAALNKQLTILRGHTAHEYDNIKLIFYSPCQDGINNETSIADTVDVSVHFLPSCTDVEFIEPDNQWVLNNSFNDTLPVVMGGYDINYGGLENISLQYKPSSSSQWIGLETFYKDTTGLNKPFAKLISTSQPYTTYFWNVDQLIDGEYNLKIVSECDKAEKNSDTYIGIIDRVNPHPFGNPQPADGILSPNDEIMIQFNETIEAGSLSYDNFDIRGVLNGTNISHSTSLRFDGSTSYATISDGLNLAKSSLTIEFWAKRTALGEQTILSQGINNDQSVYVGFDSGNKMLFNLAGSTIQTDGSYTDANWHHWAIVYDQKNELGQIYYDGSLVKTQSFITDYSGNGKTYIGKSSLGTARYFNGNLHELRIWNTARQQASIVEKMNKQLSGRESGLVGNWRFDEGDGSLSKDIARNRHAEVYAIWAIEPSGRSITFNGSGQYLDFNAGTLALNDETDFTVEFWFKSSNGANATLFSNGKGDGTDANPMGWSINTDASGKIYISQDGNTFEGTSLNYFDGKWHHFALVVQRLGNTSVYIDGNLQNKQPSAVWGEFGGPKVWLGARGWYTGIVESTDRYFSGKMDEVRVWNVARLQEQIERDRLNKLSGDEVGLMAYLPFEKYTNMAGVMVLTETLEDGSGNGYDASSYNGATYHTETPSVKLQRPVQKVNFTYSVNNDKIIFTPTDPTELIENVTLDITVKGVKDLHGNVMQSPRSWIAYIDKNQVVWEDQQKDFNKKLNDALTFTANILNNGGESKSFSIDNLPEWLTATPQTGTITPNSYKTITFTVNPGINIGNYNQDIYLHTNFNFDEKLLLNLKVYAESPVWTVNPSDYQYSMGIIGQIQVSGIISTDPEDKIAAFINGELRGVANLQYIPQFDMYQVYLDVYTNDLTEQHVTFQVWDASEGRTHNEVTPALTFEADAAIGTPSSPIVFNAINTIIQPIVLTPGWNWVSFNLSNTKLNVVSQTMPKGKNVGDIIKGAAYYEEADATGKWVGNLSNNGGIKNEEAYKIKVAQQDTIYHIGEVIDPSTMPISIVKGWNWVGFISQKNIPINDALGNYTATNGDIMKGQFSFSVYDTNMGWIGSLQNLEPTKGYMLKADAAGTLEYPKSGLYKNLRVDGETFFENIPWILSGSKFDNTMTAIATVDGCQNVMAEKLVLGAFVGNECRGYSMPTFISQNNTYAYFISISGNDQEAVSFRLFDTQKRGEVLIKEEIRFNDDELLGSITSPYILHPSSKITCDPSVQNAVDINKMKVEAYPNPFDKNISLTIQNSASSSYDLEIIDIQGNVIYKVKNRTLKDGKAQFSWDGKNSKGAEVADGMYIIQVSTSTGQVNQKIIKK